MKKLTLLFVPVLWYFTGYTETIKIHHIGVGQGDATLIVITNDLNQTASIVIDAGNSASKGEAVAAAIMEYPEIKANKRIDLVIVSHLHADHLGGIQTMLETVFDKKWTVGVVVDRAASYTEISEIDCYDGNDQDEDRDNDPEGRLPTSALVKKYKKYIADLSSEQLGMRSNYQPGFNFMNFIPGFSTQSTLLCLTSNGIACNASNQYKGCAATASFFDDVRNENDYSFSFLLELGSFKYFTGGDMGGQGAYVDLETPILQYFQTRPDAGTFHFCGYKASHHGSQHSSSTGFINYTRPTITVIPSALRSFNRSQLPSEYTWTRIKNSSNNSNIFYTYVYLNLPYKGKVGNYKDVVLFVNGSTFENNHAIEIAERLRDMRYLDETSTWVYNTIQCNKH